MGYRYDAERILTVALGVALERGLPALTFRSVGERAGIPDRTVVYYFPTKDALVAAVLEKAGSDFARLVFPPTPTSAATPQQVLSQAWTVLTHSDNDAISRLFVEVAAGSVRRIEPYRTALARVLESWTDQAAEQMDKSIENRRDVAAGIVATLDGLLFLRVSVGPEIAHRAARGLGVVT